jgi:Activator of Hsp90 ATPase homolog 1-like protein
MGGDHRAQPDQQVVRHGHGTRPPGGEGILRWDEIEVRPTDEEVLAPSRFSYRWEPGQVRAGGATTLVEFELEEIEGGTRLSLVESGFASLKPESRRENEFGWDDELGHLRAYVLERVATS